jgi:hypothetical protein
MMTFTEAKKQIFRILLAIYFFVFSTSPLTYTLSHKQVPENIYATNNESSSIKSVHLLPWEFLIERLSSLTLKENLHNDGNTRILIKIKRAIASEKASYKLFLFKNASAPKECCDPLVSSTCSLNIRSANFPGIYKGFNPIYTGHSPPSV